MTEIQGFNTDIAEVLIFAYFVANPSISSQEVITNNRAMAHLIATSLRDIYDSKQEVVQC